MNACPCGRAARVTCVDGLTRCYPCNERWRSVTETHLAYVTAALRALGRALS